MNDTSIPLVLKEAAPVRAFSVEEQAALRAKFPSRQAGRKVVVLSIEPTSLFQITSGDVFHTLKALAAAMGLATAAALCSYLRLARGAPAKLRGVTFQYLTDYQKGKSNEPTI